MTEYTRLYAPRGAVAHLKPPWLDYPEVLCRRDMPRGGWLGTGCQREYETAAALRTCRDCAKVTGGDPDAPLRVVTVDAPGL